MPSFGIVALRFACHSAAMRNGGASLRKARSAGWLKAPVTELNAAATELKAPAMRLKDGTTQLKDRTTRLKG